MRPSRLPSRSLRLLLLLVGPAASSCAPPGESDQAAVGAGAPVVGAWEQGVRDGLIAGQYRYEPGPRGFVGRNPAWALTATFDPEGATFGAHGGPEDLGLRFAAWGREGALVPVPAAAPELGDCVPGAQDALGDCLQRIEYDRDRVVEWWINGKSGLEQGFDLAEAPDGSGALVVEIAVDGALAYAEENGDAVWLYGDEGTTWRYSGPVAWDAEGEPLAAILEAEEGLIRILVDDEGAAWPVTIDPVLTTASWTVEGEQAYSEFGIVIAAAGDVDNDGFDDVAVGAPKYETGAEGNEGQVFLYYGSSAGLETTAGWSADADQASANMGYALASGDLNNDGYSDLAIGLPLYENGSTDEGAIWVFSGSASGLGTAKVSIDNNDSGDQLGWSLAIGDFDGDGYDDLAGGSHLHQNGGSDVGEGRVFIYKGSAAGVLTTYLWDLESNQANAHLAQALAAGNVNGDAYDDLVVAAPDYDNGSSNEGVVFVFHGSATGLSTTVNTQLELNQAEAVFGFSVGSGGSVNADIYDDLIVGAPLYDNGTTDEGAAFLFHGSSSGLATTAAATLDNGTNSRFGRAVALAGDIDNDGDWEALVGAPTATNGQLNEGIAYLYLGSSSGVATTASWTSEGDQATAYHGYAVSRAGDVDGDTYGDVLVAAYLYDNGLTEEGRVQMYYGDVDSDGDGSPNKQDCNDTSSAIYPGATETIGNDTDENCDSSLLCYTDGDNDGYGTTVSLSVAAATCGAGGESSRSTDCDDVEASDYPGAPETVGNGDDESCDGTEVCYNDADDDNFGTTSTKASSDTDCADANEATVTTDCDDGSNLDFPGATETVNNGDDEDCDGFDACYTDADDDSYGTSVVRDSTDLDCDNSLMATRSGDCDDTASTGASDYPGAAETVNNGDDEDCDGFDACYTDTDNDNYGTTVVIDSTDLDCDNALMATLSTDCDDGSATDYPGATEIVGNQDDESCDGTEVCYNDADSDAYGTATTKASTDVDCLDLNEATVSTDCDDGSNLDYPGAAETTGNGDDENCDGKEICYNDADSDKYGTATTKESTDTDCLDANEATVSTDCDDRSASDYPGATETVGNEDDEDCNGGEICYTDGDSDKYGTVVTKTSTDTDCADTNEATVSTDCDDTSATVKPGATETAGNDVDENCDNSRLCYTDADDDKYGTTATVATTATTCEGGSESSRSTDCDDADSADYPGATETVGNQDDESCDGTEVCYNDGDSDKYGTATTKASTDVDCIDTNEATVSSDCDDASATDYPGATETVGNEDDEDCNGGEICYSDADADTYGTTATRTSTDTDCRDTNESTVTTDCDDGVKGTYPGAAETCGDGVDSSCDGVGGGSSSDDDADGVSYGEETAAGANDCDTDSDNDGVLDGDEFGAGATARDTDGDLTPDIRDTDDDGDGVLTATEGVGDTDGDTTKDYLDTDDDGDTLLTKDELGLGDSDRDGTDDYLDDDDDDDRVKTADELAYGTEHLEEDSDGDGVSDGDEWGGGTTPRDTDGDTTIDALDEDDDDDGIPTVEEGSEDIDGDPSNECEPNPDTLGNHIDEDSDGDGKTDAAEAAEADGDLDDDGVPNWLDCNDGDGCDGDADNDGLGNCLERDTLGTNPSRKDSDGDGVEDGVEVGDPASPTNTDGDDLIDALDLDDDGDGLPTSEELPRGDTDGDTRPDYLDTDDDGDGVSTADEDRNDNGDWSDDDSDGDDIPDFLDAIEDGPLGDNDGDGLSNEDEETLTLTDPLQVDTDGDGIPDGIEVGADTADATDSDDDGTIDALDPDDDGDGVPTDDEGTFDTDGDGTPNHLDLDSDGDGAPDADEGTEDPDCDGAPEFLDADETDGPCMQSNVGGDTDEIGGGDKGCGCGTAPRTGSGWLGLLALAGIARRRRQR